jgi:O-methyltransferase
MTRKGPLAKVMARLRPKPQAGRGEQPLPDEATMTEREREIVAATLPNSITSKQRIVAVLDAVRYCVARDIPGVFAECGVWRGGSVMAMIYALQDLGRDDRDIYLYDTFEGMTEPTEHDTSRVDRSAQEWFAAAEEKGVGRAFPQFFNPEVFNEDMVRENLLATGYPEERLHFVRGRVEDTLPAQAPEQIALLRLDTDWYESTRHELIHLYPRLAGGGVLIIDDYGHWDGARRAVDEYFASEAPPLLLGRIDYTGRIAVKH